jgi:hypothetical protein
VRVKLLNSLKNKENICELQLLFLSLHRSKFNRGHDVAHQGGNFYATNFREIMLLQHRVGSLDNTPKAFHD